MDDMNIQQLYKNASPKETRQQAEQICLESHGNTVLLRGLIEFSNYCIMNCNYCGIRKDNNKVKRYRISEKDILEIAEAGFKRGLRTFVLQAGEDPWYSDSMLCNIISEIKRMSSNEAAVTLSIGIKSRSQLQEYRSAGADRYLLRFETSDADLFEKLRPGTSLKRRLKMLETLQEEGFQTGSGFMIGLPRETDETVINNILLCKSLQLDMVGIGPFIPNKETPLAKAECRSIDKAILATACLRIALPKTHIPATTAAGSLHPQGREMMISAGANVLMPNITPPAFKQHYLLYPGKICLDESGFKCIGCLELRVKPLGRKLSFERGDSIMKRGCVYV
jgi:biotin synthase